MADETLRQRLITEAAEWKLVGDADGDVFDALADLLMEAAVALMFTEAPRYSCKQCQRDFNHESFTVTIGSLPGRTSYFCSVECRQRFNMNYPALPVVQDEAPKANVEALLTGLAFAARDGRSRPLTERECDKILAALGASRPSPADPLLQIAGLVNSYHNDGTTLSAAETLKAIADVLGDPFHERPSPALGLVEQSTLDRIDASLAGVNGLPPHITIEDALWLRARMGGPSPADLMKLNMKENSMETPKFNDPSEGPFEFAWFSRHCGTPIETIADVIETLSISAAKSTRAELFGVCLAERDEDGKQIVVCYTGNGPRSEANARLIAELLSTYRTQAVGSSPADKQP